MALPQWVINAVNAITPVAEASGSSLPQWARDSLGAISPLVANANRQTHLAYNTAVQGVGNQLGNAAPTPTQETQHLALRGGSSQGGDYPPPLQHDLYGEQYRNSVADSMLTPLAANYLKQVPVGMIDKTIADLAHRDIHGQPNWAVLPGRELSSGSMKSTGYPIQGVYSTRPDSGGHYEHHQGGVNADGENTAGWDEWIPGPNPTQQSVSMDDTEKMALRVALIGAAAKAAGGIDTARFNQDLNKLKQAGPWVYDDLSYLNGPEWANASENEKLQSAFRYLGAKYGAGLKTTPIWNHYEGIIR